MMFNVLKHYHVMVGIPYLEWHDAILPPAPPPPVPAGHICGGLLCFPPWGVLTGKPNPKEISASGGIMLSMGTDMGPLIPHYNLLPPAPPNSLLSAIILTSGSKSHFGAHKNKLPQGSIAFACAVVVNFNLNCAGLTRPPLPSGLVITFNTHTTGATLGDVLAGALHLVFDLLVQFGLNRFFKLKFVQNLVERVFLATFGRILSRITGYAIGKGITAATSPGALIAMLTTNKLGIKLADQLGIGIVDNLFGGIVTLMVGSPVGYSPGRSLLGDALGDPVGNVHNNMAESMDNYFNSPDVAQHPETPQGTPDAGPAKPPSTGAPAPG